MANKLEPCIITIFGATGDLTHRKLIPALYKLEADELLHKDSVIFGFSRRQKKDSEFRKELHVKLAQFSRIKIRPMIWQEFSKKIHYHSSTFQDLKGFESYKAKLKKICSTNPRDCNKIFYLATNPDFFQHMVQNLKKSGLSHGLGWSRVVFEKPFGRDLKTAKELNKEITKVFNEDQIYRIDHYLAKELVQNLLVMRFSNLIFEPLWNADNIDHVQITVAETLGIEGRGEFYDKAGSLKDVVQNHIMQLLCLTAMSSPKSLAAEDIRNEKVKVLRSIAKIKNIWKDSVKGQYTSSVLDNKAIPSYLEEADVAKNSPTSTYFALKFFVKNKRWKNVPFYIRTGKRLKDKATEIILVYKHSHSGLFKKEPHNLSPNMLMIRVQPDEGISIEFNVKVPGNKVLIEPVNMDFCHECKFGPNTPEAYERLLHDVMLGDQTLFARWDEVENAWRIIDPIRDSWHGIKPAFYKAGTWGPEEAENLLKRDGRHWIEPKKPYYAGLLTR